MRQIKLRNKSSTEFKFDLNEIPKDFNIDYENSYIGYSNSALGKKKLSAIDTQVLMINPLVFKNAKTIDIHYLTNYKSSNIVGVNLTIDENNIIGNDNEYLGDENSEYIFTNDMKKQQLYGYYDIPVVFNIIPSNNLLFCGQADGNVYDAAFNFKLFLYKFGITSINEINNLTLKTHYAFSSNLIDVLICSDAQDASALLYNNICLILNETYKKPLYNNILISNTKYLEYNETKAKSAYLLVNYDTFNGITINNNMYQKSDKANMKLVPGCWQLTTLNYDQQPQEAVSIYMINLIPDSQGKIVIKSDSDFAIRILD